jgi:hypothetical protein
MHIVDLSCLEIFEEYKHVQVKTCSAFKLTVRLSLKILLERIKLHILEARIKIFKFLFLIFASISLVTKWLPNTKRIFFSKQGIE